MESLKDIVSDIRVFLYGGILTLPLTIAGTLSILGLFTANYAVLFFLVGFLILTPIAAFLIDLGFTNVFPTWFTAKKGDVCGLVIPMTTIKSPVGSEDKPVFSTPWTAMVAFFTGYIFTNALELYNRDSPDNNITITGSSASDISTKVTNRKSQAIMSMISIIIFALVVFGFRYYSGCEDWKGMILTILAFIFIGNGWYQALSKVGQDRLSDLFGIANRLLPPSAISNAPIACIPIPS
jgi:hypothetical protein